MSNYTQTTFFTPKDTLPVTDPNKTIFGAAYDTEFANISTAIASKVDSASNATLLSLNVTGSTPSANGVYLPAANTLGITSNGVQRANINSNGVWTFNAPTSAAPTSIQFNTNGNGTGNDFDIAGSFNGTNEFFMRATNAGTAAKAVVAAADASSFGLTMLAAGAGYTGTLATGGPTGRGGALTLNYNSPLSIGQNSNANIIIGSTQVAVGVDISARGIYLARLKPGDTSLSTTTALNTDPDLQIAIGIGTFYFRAIVNVTTASGGATPGFRFGINYTGTCTNGSQYFQGFNGVQVNGTGASNTNIAGVVSYNGNLATSSLFLFEGFITTTTAGTVSFAWGQSVSSATAVVVKTGSTFQISQIS